MFFVVDYDYGTGSTYLGVLADSAEQVETVLKDVRVVDSNAPDLSPDLIDRLKHIAKPLSDPFWDEMRR
ncbi:MAG: hypothetical protein K2P58_03015 [Hyphomonadaceae bacterium]|nr:hypothetical protein [Hyphomonadaceae bacterium]